MSDGDQVFRHAQTIVNKEQLLTFFDNLLEGDEKIHFSMIGDDFSQFALNVYREPSPDVIEIEQEGCIRKIEPVEVWEDQPPPPMLA